MHIECIEKTLVKNTIKVNFQLLISWLADIKYIEKNFNFSIDHLSKKFQWDLVIINIK